jgi:protein-S-isoprenylcysteine O-methyltransferase Ste14
VTRTHLGELAIRAAALYLPIALTIAVAARVRPDRRHVAGALLATAWNGAGLLAVNLVAVEAGWWRFGVEAGAVAGVPADLWLGWALLWGAVPVLATTRWPAVVAALLVAADLVLMPLAEPVVDLDPTWPVGEAVAVAACLVPGMLLGRWTATGTRLAGRVALQVVGFAGLVYFLLPTLGFAAAGGGWGPLLARPAWQLAVAGLVLAPVGAVALWAVREFAAHGGTPLPLDPPERLVTTGPYAHVANPMQLTGTVLLAGWGVLLASPAVVAAAGMAAAFSAGVAAWHEEAELDRRFGAAWRRYRRSVRLWLPPRRRRPRHRPVAPPERAFDTGRIRPTGGHPGWFAGCVEHTAENAEAQAEQYLRRFAATSPRRRSRVAADAPIESIQQAALHHADPFVRRGCLGFLDHYANEASALVFARALHDPVEPVRHTALDSIACETCRVDDLCVADVVPHVAEVLAADPCPELRHKSIPVLLRLADRDQRARAAVERAADEDDLLVREVARLALDGHHVRRRKAYQRRRGADSR